MDSVSQASPKIKSSLINQIKNHPATPRIKKFSAWALIILVLLLCLGYWWYSSHYVSTDDAYVNANVIQIAPQVTGQVKELNIINNQYVKKGDVLFTIDPAPFIVAVDEATAQLAMNEAKLQNAQVTETRIQDLVNQNAMSKQEGDNTSANLKSAQAAVQLTQAELAQAQLDLSYTTITAFTSGWVSNVSLRVGDIVTADRLLFALISDEEFWIDSNFKETQLRFVQVGQEAEIQVDMYPGKKFKGVVESISGASGSAFSLLPPQNATGNWVKITQRVPARVRVLDHSKDFPLRIGTSANVSMRVDQKLDKHKPDPQTGVLP